MKNLTTGLFLSVFSVGSAASIIDSEINNGSFESGELSPWSGGTVVFDPSGSPDGNWYAQTVATVDTASLFLSFPAVDNNIRDFAVSFYMKSSPGGFTWMGGYFYGETEANGRIYPVIVSASGELIADWTYYVYHVEFEDSWDISKNMSFGINFGGGAPGSVGYVDKVTLTQIPEPASFGFYVSGAAIAFTLIRRRGLTKR